MAAGSRHWQCPRVAGLGQVAGPGPAATARARSKTARWPSGWKTASTLSADARRPATAMSAGMSVMCSSRCPLTGSRHSAHGQLSRSQAAGRPAASALAGRLVMLAPFMIAAMRLSTGWLAGGVLPMGTAEYSRTRQTGDSRCSPGPAGPKTHPARSVLPAAIVGTLGSMATRVPQGTAQPRASGSGRPAPGPPRPASGQGRAPGQGRAGTGQPRPPGNGGRTRSTNAMPARTASRTQRRPGSYQGKGKKRPHR